jgi:hypothetical protein
MTEVRVLSSAGITRPRRSYDPVRLPPGPSPSAMSKSLPPTGRVSPDYPFHPSSVPRPIPRRIEWLHASIASPSVSPSPFGRRVGIHIGTFEACSGFTHVAARWIAQPPKATFVTRLQSGQSPGQTARQLPGQSTIPWVEPTSTGKTRLRGALPNFRLFSPSFRKHFFGGFRGYQWVTVPASPVFERSKLLRRLPPKEPRRAQGSVDGSCSGFITANLT